jgi:histidine phosphotransferase ChpT
MSVAGTATGPVELSALVSARLCHDLVSPLGAIGNGVELIQMGGTARGGGEAELALISDSLSNAIGKLKFLRVAFGPADPEARQTFEDAAAITGAAFRGRFSVTWTRVSGSMPRPLAKAIFLALLCLERSLPLGGEVRVRVEEETAALSVDGRRTAAPGDLWAHVTDGAGLAPITSDMVQFTLLRHCLEAFDGRIEAAFADTSAELRLGVPVTAPA